MNLQTTFYLGKTTINIAEGISYYVKSSSLTNNQSATLMQAELSFNHCFNKPYMIFTLAMIHILFIRFRARVNTPSTIREPKPHLHYHWLVKLVHMQMKAERCHLKLNN